MYSFFTYIGVPLFLMLSGFLNVYKELSIGHFKSIKRILFSYLMISVITWFILAFNGMESWSIRHLVGATFRFSMIGYAWYIEMYIWLFLLIPFLNMIFAECTNKKTFLLFLAILFSISILPEFTNRYGFHFLPDYWTALSMVFYYSLGGYIRYFHPKTPPLWFSRYQSCWFFVVLLLCSVNSIFSFIIKEEHKFVSILGGLSSPAAVLLTTILFLSLYQVKHIWGGMIITGLAVYSLDMYLFSYLFDRLLYPYAKQLWWINQSQFFLYYLPITGSVLLFSFSAAWLKKKIFRI